MVVNHINLIIVRNPSMVNIHPIKICQTILQTTITSKKVPSNYKIPVLNLRLIKMLQIIKILKVVEILINLMIKGEILKTMKTA